MTGRISAGQRFQIGASLLPPVALLWAAARSGWVPVPPVACLVAMPLVVLLGLAIPEPFQGWHRGVQRIQSWIGHQLLALVLALIFVLILVPTGLLLRLLGRSFLEAPSGPSFWRRARPPGSLHDPF